MYIWKENIKRAEQFYNSDYYQTLRAENPSLIRKALNSILLDPDADDEELYQEKAADLGLVASGFEVYDGEFKLGMDCAHGWKALYDACGGGRDSLDLYAKIRSSLNGHMLWPRYTMNTINILRYRMFRDRVDYSLYDIKLFYAFLKEYGITSHEEFVAYCEYEVPFRMTPAYKNEMTFKWLNKFGTFEHLIRRMKLDCFCHDNGEVIDMDTMGELKGFGENIVDKNYLENLTTLL